MIFLIRFVFFILFSFCYIGMCTAGSVVPPTKTPIIIDTDMGFDDWLAILYALKDPSVDVLAITISGSGETHCTQGTTHLKQLLDLVKAPNIPIACGREKPILGKTEFPPFIREETDTMNNITLPPSSRQVTHATATQLLHRILMGTKRKVTIVTIGPLTNIALTLDQYPEVIDHISSIIIGGGAINIPGNLNIPGMFETNNVRAEWNIYCDPIAAVIVFAARVPKVLVPTDVSQQFFITEDLVAEFQKQAKSPASKFTLKVFNTLRDRKTKGFERFRLWDPVTIFSAIATPQIVKTKKEFLTIVTTYDSYEFGRIMKSDTGTPIEVVKDIDNKLFYSLFLSTINT